MVQGPALRSIFRFPLLFDGGDAGLRVEGLKPGS